MEAMTTRLIAGAGVVAVVILGGWSGTGLMDEHVAKAKELLAQEIPPEYAREQALAAQPTYTDTPVYYRTQLEATLATLELQADVDALIEQLHQPNVFYHPISHGAPVTMKVGEVRREQSLALAVVHEELRIKRGGLESNSLHTLLQVTNQGSVALTYRLIARSKDGGDCKLRAITQYDAIVLDPGETARISICSGAHEVELVDLRMMELAQPIQIRWLRQLPPDTLGLDDIAQRSHKSAKTVLSCGAVPSEETGKKISGGAAQWEDVADFYSRHDCNLYRWPDAYERIVSPLAELPAKP
jgi:hypothetical protein